MDVLIQQSGQGFTSGPQILVGFRAYARIPNQDALTIEFYVPYAFGASTAQKRNAIFSAAQTAANDYATGAGITLPAVNNIDVIGL